MLDSEADRKRFCLHVKSFLVQHFKGKAERLAVNGMSYHARDGKNANSAIIVTVTPQDFAKPGPLAGVEFQRSLEAKAYELGAGTIASAVFIPSIAADIMPPAYPAPSPQGYTP